MGAAEMKAGHEEEYVDGTSAAPWPQLDGVRLKTLPSLVGDRRNEDGEGRAGAKYNTSNIQNSTNHYTEIRCTYNRKRAGVWPLHPVRLSVCLS